MALFYYCCEECGYEGTGEEDDHPWSSHEIECPECGAEIEGQELESHEIDFDD